MMDDHSISLRKWAAGTPNAAHKLAQNNAADHIDALRRDIESLHQELNKAHLGEDLSSK